MLKFASSLPVTHVCTTFAAELSKTGIVTETSILRGKLAVFFTLGCKLNFAETATISQRLAEAGVRTVVKGEHADICIVNTCSVTEVADHKCRQAIHKLVRQHPQAFVIVMGCYAQLKPEQVAGIEGVDLVLSQSEKGNVMHYLENYFSGQNVQEHAVCSGPASDKRSGGTVPFVPSCSRGERTRYFLKVQDGCNYFCTYCTIPLARGRSRNGSIASLVSQVREAAAAGGKEIVITGVNIGDFGRTTGESFLDLLRALDGVEGIERYRISSIEPNLLTDEILQFCAGSRAFMPHFHIPLQSGSDEVLRLMHRRYDTSLFYNKVSRARELMPDCFIGVDVIVGTRGETESLFAESERFIESLPISQLHVFSYSERSGTAALRIPHVVRPEEKHERSQRLLAISERKLHSFYERFIGSERPVLLEHSRVNNLFSGYTDNYIKVEYAPSSDVTSPDSLPRLDNQILPFRLVGWNADGTSLIAQ